MKGVRKRGARLLYGILPIVAAMVFCSAGLSSYAVWNANRSIGGNTVGIGAFHIYKPYTVEYYYEDGGGTYVKDGTKTQELRGIAGAAATVSEDSIAANAGPGYEVNPAAAGYAASGTVLTDGSLILKICYKKIVPGGILASAAYETGNGIWQLASSDGISAEISEEVTYGAEAASFKLTLPGDKNAAAVSFANSAVDLSGYNALGFWLNAKDWTGFAYTGPYIVYGGANVPIAYNDNTSETFDRWIWVTLPLNGAHSAADISVAFQGGIAPAVSNLAGSLYLSDVVLLDYTPAANVLADYGSAANSLPVDSYSSIGSTAAGIRYKETATGTLHFYTDAAGAAAGTNPNSADRTYSRYAISLGSYSDALGSLFTEGVSAVRLKFSYYTVSYTGNPAGTLLFSFDTFGGKNPVTSQTAEGEWVDVEYIVTSGNLSSVQSEFVLAFAASSFGTWSSQYKFNIDMYISSITYEVIAAPENLLIDFGYPSLFGESVSGVTYGGGGYEAGITDENGYGTLRYYDTAANQRAYALILDNALGRLKALAGGGAAEVRLTFKYCLNSAPPDTIKLSLAVGDDMQAALIAGRQTEALPQTGMWYGYETTVTAEEIENATGFWLGVCRDNFSWNTDNFVLDICFTSVTYEVL